MNQKQKEYFREYCERRYLEEFKPAYDEWIKLYPLTLEDLPDEIWRPIPDYEGLYDESNYGRTKSFWYGREKILKPRLTKHGYLRIALSKEGKQKHFSVARLVALCFIPNPLNLPEVDHINGDKEQVLYIRNNPDNLTIAQLAKMFNCSPSQIWHIVNSND